MTLIRPRSVDCANCGRSTQVNQLMSWSQFSKPRLQLDLRNDQAPRGLLALGLQRCGHCGHTARDLSAPMDETQRNALHRFDLADYGLDGERAIDDIAGLLLHAQQCQARERPREAALAWIQAAWLLDDRIEASSGRSDAAASDTLDALRAAAAHVRRRAASAVKRSMATPEPLAPGPSGWAVHADLLRRAGDFARAAAACREVLKGERFDDDEALTVRDRLQHTLNLATDEDARAAYIDDAEARAVDYPERLARREAGQLVDEAQRKARAAVARQEAQARVAPMRLVERLASGADEGGPSGGLPADWPLPEPMRALMAANARAYGWSQDALAPVLVAALARVLGPQASRLAGYLARQAGLLARHEAEVAYMARVLRETTPEQWAFRAPPEGFRRESPVSKVRLAARQRFHVEWPDEYWPDTLMAVGDGDLLSTQPARLPELLMGPPTPERLHDLEDGHLTIGFWGHGSNSYAFYVVRKQADERLYLRLHTGGAYTDPKQAAAEITDFVPVLLHLVSEVRRLGGRLVAIQGIGSGDYAVLVGSQARRLQGSLLGRPDAMTLVQRMLDQVQGNAPAFDPSALREQAHRLAMAQYTEATRAGGNVRVPMRALGEAMHVIRRSGIAASAAEYRHQLLADLAALAERHQDLDGDHEGGRRAVRRLIETLKQAPPG